MVAISYRNGVSIAEIVVYIPTLSIAILLVIRHGLFKIGWNFLIAFLLARITGPCFELAATMHGPINIKLVVGAAILQGIGLSPLMMIALEFLNHVIKSIKRNGQITFPDTPHLKFVQLILVVGLLLGVAGGVKTVENLEKTGKYVPIAEGKAGTALFVMVYILLALTTIHTLFKFSEVNEPDDRRLLVAVGLSLPFLLVRVIYSALSAFDSQSSPKFNQLSGSATIWLFTSIIMEMVVVFIYEVVGLSLNKIA